MDIEAEESARGRKYLFGSEAKAIEETDPPGGQRRSWDSIVKLISPFGP